MSTVPLHSLGTQAQIMAKNCNNEKMAMTLQYVAIGSMLVMALAGTVHLIKDIAGGGHKELASEECRRLHERVRSHKRER